MTETYPLWQEYYTKRLAWAYNAKNDFINSIDNEEFRSLYNRNEDKSVNIAVYGRSQVGKTSLILELIGVKKESREYISNILRADIPPGQSVTPTSIIYQKSRDDHFYYIEGENDCLVNADKLKQKLKDLRNRVENNVELRNLGEVMSNVLIKIPGKYFTQRNSLNINIIDLPGFGSANEKEQRHVKKVIENITPILNLVLIVSNKITDLVNSDKPCRQFRYILTRSVSSDSVRKKFEEGVIKDKKTYLKFVETEFEIKPARGTVYPLEYGDSWDKLETNIKNKAESIIEELFKDLREDISKSSSEYNQLMQNANHFKYIEEMIHQELRKFEQQNTFKAKEEKNLDTDLKSVQEVCAYWNEEKKKLSQLKLSDRSYFFKYSFSRYNGEIKVSKLKQFLKTSANGICSYAQEEWKRIIKLERFSEIHCKPILEFSEISTKEASVIRAKLRDYWIDEYYTDSAKVDKRLCEDVCEKIYQQIKGKIEVNYSKLIEKSDKDIDDRILEHEKRITGYHYEILKIKRSIKEVVEELSKLKIEKKEFEISSKKNLATAKKFKHFLQEGYLKEKKMTIEKLNDIENSREERFFDFLYLSLISSEYKKLINQPPV